MFYNIDYTELLLPSAAWLKVYKWLSSNAYYTYAITLQRIWCCQRAVQKLNLEN